MPRADATKTILAGLLAAACVSCLAYAVVKFGNFGASGGAGRSGGARDRRPCRNRCDVRWPGRRRLSL